MRNVPLNKLARKSFVVFLAAIMVTVMWSSCVSAAGNYYTEATPITFGKTYNGTISESNTIDWYKFTISRSGYVEIKGQAFMHTIYYSLHSGEDCSERYFRDYINWDDISKVSNKTYTFYLKAGTYYFCVAQYSDYTGKYSLKFNYTDTKESFVESLTKGDDSMDTAHSISLNTTYKGCMAYNDGADFYKFVLPVNSTVTINFTSYDMNSIDLYIYNANGEKVHSEVYLSSDSNGIINLSRTLELAKGTYYFVVSKDYYHGLYTFNLSSNDVKPLAIKTQPTDVTGAIGTTATFTVKAQGTGIKYRWQTYKDGKWVDSTFAGCNTASLSVDITRARDGYKFRCVVTDYAKAKVISNTVVLHVSPITIVTQPKNYTGKVGATAKFKVVAEGTGLKYQWQTNSGGKWVNSSLTGAKTATLSVPVTVARNGYKFRCVITDSKNNKLASKSATLSVIDAVPLAITTQPKSYTGPVGSTATFKIKAQGVGLKYQWQTYKNGKWVNSSLAGANSATLYVDVTKARNGYKFRCVVTDASKKTVTSKTVTLKVG